MGVPGKDSSVSPKKKVKKKGSMHGCESLFDDHIRRSTPQEKESTDFDDEKKEKDPESADLVANRENTDITKEKKEKRKEPTELVLSETEKNESPKRKKVEKQKEEDVYIIESLKQKKGNRYLIMKILGNLDHPSLTLF